MTGQADEPNQADEPYQADDGESFYTLTALLNRQARRVTEASDPELYRQLHVDLGDATLGLYQRVDGALQFRGRGRFKDQGPLAGQTEFLLTGTEHWTTVLRADTAARWLDLKDQVSWETGVGAGSALHLIRERPAEFAPPAITLLSDPHTQAGVRSMWAPLEWQRPTSGAPFYKDKNLVLVYAKDASDIVLSLDDAKANAFIICLGKWWAETSGDTTWPRDARIYVEDILAFRGIKKHVHGGYEPKQKEAVKEDILALRHLWVRSHQQIWETTRSGKRRLVDVDVDDPLVEVSVESTVDLWGERAPYAIRFRPGPWARYYLGDAQHWTTPVLKTVMGYDPRYDRLKMRLGIYLAFQWRIRARKSSWDQPWKLRTLLEGAKVDIPKRNPQRFFPQVIRALEGLRADGVLTVCEALDFPDWTVPADEPPKRWVPKLLDGRWRLLPVAAVRDRLPRLPDAPEAT